MITHLRYLFVACFTDGTQFYQNDEDVSELNPTKSCYYDLLEKCKSKKLNFFMLVNDEKSYAVDLDTGLFEIGQEWWNLQPSSSPIPQGGEYELIYFRDHEAKLTVNSEGEILTTSDTHKYRIGWHYRLGDRTWTQTLVVN